MPSPLRCQLAWLALLATTAQAGDDTCRLTTSQSSVDFGQFNRALQSTRAAEHALGERRLSLTLNCDEPADMQLFYRAVAATNERLRFADQGSYALQVGEAQLDGQGVELGLIAGPGQSPSQIAPRLDWRPEHGVVPLKAGVPTKGKTLSVQLLVNAWATEPALQVRDAVTWEAAGRFETASGQASRELQLRTRFAPAACELGLSNGGVVDFGRIAKSQLNAQQSTRLPGKALMLNVDCDAPALFALRMVDNREGSATVNSEIYYGLGVDPSANRIGLYALQLDPADASADSVPKLYRTDSTTGGVAWSTSNASPIAMGANSYLGFTHLAGSQAGPVAIAHLSSRVTVEAVIAPTSTLDLSSEVQLDGSGTLEIIYL